MDQLLYILFGWLLGLLSPGIVERIRRRYRQADLVAAVISELRELQYIMGFVAYQTRSRLGLVTDGFLDWLLPIVRSYEGPGGDPKVVQAMVECRRELSEDQRRQVHLATAKPGTAPGFKEYRLPLLLALAGEISICPLEFQRRVFWIGGRLELYNQQVVFLRTQFEKTFDPSITGENRQAVELNLSRGCQQLADAAELIANAVAEVASAWGKSSSLRRGSHPNRREPGGG